MADVSAQLRELIDRVANAMQPLAMALQEMRTLADSISVGETPPKPEEIRTSDDLRWLVPQSNTHYVLSEGLVLTEPKLVNGENIRFSGGSITRETLGHWFVLGRSCEGIEFDGITFWGPDVEGKEGVGAAVYAAGKNIGVSNCTGINVGYLVYSNHGLDGLDAMEIVGCTAVEGVQAYCVYVEGRDILIEGNRFHQLKPPGQGHCIRTGGVVHLTIKKNELLRNNNASLYITHGEDVWIDGNTVIMGDIGIGPMRTQADRDKRLKNVTVARNTIEEGKINIYAGTDGAHVTGNIVHSSSGGIVNLEGNRDDLGRVLHDVLIQRNTLVLSNKQGAFLTSTGRPNTVDYVGNLHIAPADYVGGDSEPLVKLGQPDLNGWGIRNNVWPMPRNARIFYRLSTDPQFKTGPNVGKEQWETITAGERWINASKESAAQLDAGAIR